MKKNIGILGYGEIGKSLFSLYKENNIIPYIKDLNINQFNKIDILNVCIPYDKNFVIIISEEINKLNPKLIIVHSTVPIGTIRKIEKNISNKNKIVHSPVRGNHPKLKKSLKVFIKYIGSNDKKGASLTKKHFKLLGIKSNTLKSSEHTEAFKLFCTSYYGLCILWHNEMKKICDKFDLNFNLIKKWNESYNQGYFNLKQKKFNRPILDYPKNNKIGGHCIISNAKILDNHFNSNIIKEILKYE
jgi:UDP-N-acetyl-D-mannosaminuronate dehydrogenase